MCLVVVGVALGLGQAQQSRHLREVMSDQVNTVRLEREVLETEILGRVADAVFLADVASLALANSGGQAPAGRLLEKTFILFSREQRGYDQVRLLDASGWERVRVNRTKQGPRLVPPAQLQDKSKRYYFHETMRLKVGEVYISPFDLNVEHGELERPYKPTLRFASPVAGPEGGKRGVVVLNFLGQRLLDRLRRASRAEVGQMYWINRQGWWLLGPSSEHEWGFMLASRCGHNMGEVFPQAWEAMATGYDGQKLTPNGLFTFQAVKVLNQPGKDGSFLPKGKLDDFWWVVSRMPPEALVLPWRWAYVWVVLGVLALLALLTRLWAAARTKRALAEKEVQSQQRRLEAIVNTAQDAVALVDSNDRVHFWNHAAERLFGYDRQEALGNELHRMVASPKLLAKAKQGMAAFARTGQGPILEEPREFMARRKDGSTFPVELSAAAFQLDGVWFAAGNVRDITERKQAEQEFKRLANTDDLTGTLNRRRFLELAQAEVLRAQRYGSPLSLLMLDLDHFKAINDTYGHGVGDLVLRSLVEVSKEVLRVVDVFGRVGGEEFMALLPETNLEGALTVAERLRAAFAARTVTAGGNEIRCTASLGVAVLAPDMTLEQLMKAADEALYQAKKRGRNQVVAYQAPAPQT
jgi:diguanylate cyclase (GGDEF)-like protein/PAS domain S-box-containing protein